MNDWRAYLEDIQIKRKKLKGARFVNTDETLEALHGFFNSNPTKEDFELIMGLELDAIMVYYLWRGKRDPEVSYQIWRRQHE